MNNHSYNIDMEKTLDIVKLTKMEKILKVASDLTRLKILFSLFDEHHCHDNSMDCGLCKCKLCLSEKSVNEIVVLTNCSQSLVSHQLKILKDAKLVVSRKEGTKVFYSLADGHIKVLLKVIREHIEEESLDD